ncbi:hypothetical protein C8Q80DRAFT_1274418 [Daedaleopsis nitida]|nr:hypothetical protein C8Q80DRAFT_1274418 [Daedaleopsis nitida]
MADLTSTVSGLSEVIDLFSETVMNLALASSTEGPCQDLINLFEDLQATMRGVPSRSFDSNDEELFQEFEEVKVAANRLYTLLSAMMAAMMEYVQCLNSIHDVPLTASTHHPSHLRQIRAASKWFASVIIEDMKQRIAAAHQDFRSATEVMSQDSSFVALISKAEADARVLAALPRIRDAKIDHVHHKYLSGTMTSLLDELEGWMLARDRRCTSTDQCMWYLTGGAYTGKSTAAAEFCRRLAAQGLLGASFKYYDEYYNEAKLLFPTLAVQLATSQPVLRQHIVSAANEMEIPWDVMKMRIPAGSSSATCSVPSQRTIRRSTL